MHSKNVRFPFQKCIAGRIQPIYCFENWCGIAAFVSDPGPCTWKFAVDARRNHFDGCAHFFELGKEPIHELSPVKISMSPNQRTSFQIVHTYAQLLKPWSQ